MILNEFFNINENDPELERRFSSARKHYSHLHKPQDVMNKLFQRSMLHSEEKDADHDAKFQRLSREIEQIKQQLASLKQQQQQKEK